MSTQNDTSLRIGQLMFDNGRYGGPITKDGKMQGEGIFWYKDGSRYIGQYNNGVRNGLGELFDKFTNLYYKGDFKNDKFDGKGIFYFNNGNRYEGDFKNDKRHGKGIFYFNNGDRYDGDFKNGKFDGKGIYYIKKSGNRYEGDFKNGKRHGKGIFYFNNGDRYDGDFKNGKFDGKGIYYIKKSGDRYEGDFKNDKRHGKGIFYFNNGDRYDGDFKNGKFEGKGIYYFKKSGDRYEGDFKNGILLNKRKVRKNRKENRKVAFIQVNEIKDKLSFLNKYQATNISYDYIDINDNKNNQSLTSKKKINHIKIYYQDHGNNNRKLTTNIISGLFKPYQNNIDLKSIYISSTACHGGFYDASNNNLFEEIKKIIKTNNNCIGFVSLNKQGNNILIKQTKNIDDSYGIKRVPINTNRVNVDDVHTNKDKYFEYYCILNENGKQNIYKIPAQLCYWREVLIDSIDETYGNKFIRALRTLQSGKPYVFTYKAYGMNGEVLSTYKIEIKLNEGIEKIEKVEVKEVEKPKIKTDYKQYEIKAVNNDEPLIKTINKDNLHK